VVRDRRTEGEASGGVAAASKSILNPRGSLWTAAASCPHRHCGRLRHEQTYIPDAATEPLSSGHSPGGCDLGPDYNRPSTGDTRRMAGSDRDESGRMAAAELVAGIRIGELPDDADGAAGYCRYARRSRASAGRRPTCRIAGSADSAVRSGAIASPSNRGSLTDHQWAIPYTAPPWGIALPMRSISVARTRARDASQSCCCCEAVTDQQVVALTVVYGVATRISGARAARAVAGARDNLAKCLRESVVPLVREQGRSEHHDGFNIAQQELLSPGCARHNPADPAAILPSSTRWRSVEQATQRQRLAAKSLAAASVTWSRNGMHRNARAPPSTGG